MRFLTAQDVATEYEDTLRARIEGVLFDDGAIPVAEYIRLTPTIDKLIAELSATNIEMLHEYATPVKVDRYDW